ncbi:Zn-dependent oxidoreductase, NADPH:quinone reductase [Spongiibacter sp. IMCC21906]|uniref:zinc-dependent alcohol dehydrogenase family protein n=1 Tax=Spongiibacter sp. IMCC21906 TaxID=1620392 RepID=UPI00062E0AD8|nr:NAD(P)-dependent alcohol dehydrogenase [Spongiibacter sp. IMCC21906]AKH68437.1 Zn-dependent oxidoreductase, NADPH:quinone reductase [Spongiibacter sp. IMCC21906]
MRVIEVKAPGGLSALSLSQRPEPTAGPGEVLVNWKASSLNFHDYAVVIGAIPAEDGRIPMSDGAGEIIAVGEGVSQWQVGDKVLSTFFPHWQEGAATAKRLADIAGDSVDGFAVDVSCLPAGALTAMPENYSFAEAATLPCAALTAWRALVVESKIKAGDSVLVEGTGGLSIFSLQIAKASGAYVYATTSSEDKMSKLKALGADEIINYKTDPEWGETVHRLSQGGVDHVIDAGGAATLHQSIAAAKVGGNINLIGILGGREVNLALPTIFFKQLKLNGIAVGSGQMQKDMVKAIEATGLKPVIDRSFAFEQLAEAFEYQASGAHFGKIVIEY